MEGRYADFIEEIRRSLVNMLECKQEDVYFQAQGGRMAEQGDSIIVSVNGKCEKGFCCGLHIRKFFEDVERKKISVPEVLNYFMENILKVKIYKDKLDVRDYAEVKKRMFIRAINCERNKGGLENHVYKVVGDIALVLYYHIAQQEGSQISVKVPKKHLAIWGIAENEIWEAAMDNSLDILPPRIFDWMKWFMNPEYEGDDFMTDRKYVDINYGQAGNCVSTINKVNGATVIFLPGVAEKMADYLEDDLFLVFTSIHETMVHGVRNADADILNMVQKDTISCCIQENEILTEKVYFYSRKSKKIMIYGEEEYKWEMNQR